MHVSTVDLPPPAIAYFDLTVAGRSAVTDDEMIGESVLHAANVAVVVIENARTALAGAAIMDDDELPPPPQHRRVINLAPDTT